MTTFLGRMIRTVTHVDGQRLTSDPMLVVAEHPCAHAMDECLLHGPALELRGPLGERILAYATEVEPDAVVLPYAARPRKRCG